MSPPHEVETKADRKERALGIVRRSAAWAFAWGLVPLPVLDVAALTVVNVAMVEKLAKLYEVPFSRVKVEAYVGGLLGGTLSAEIGLGALKAGLAIIPVVGPVLGLASMSAAASSSTYGIGQMFIAQLEAGNPVLETDDTEERAPQRAAEPPRRAADDLTIVIGIGPKIAELLATKGIKTFAELAATPVASLQDILSDAGPSYAYHDPSTWPEQAVFASEGRLAEWKVSQPEPRP